MSGNGRFSCSFSLTHRTNNIPDTFMSLQEWRKTGVTSSTLIFSFFTFAILDVLLSHGPVTDYKVDFFSITTQFVTEQTVSV